MTRKEWPMARGDRSPRSEHADRTRSALLDAALDLFSAHGYDETTTDESPRRRGCPRGPSSTSPPRSRCCSPGIQLHPRIQRGLSRPRRVPVGLRGDGGVVRPVGTGTQAHPKADRAAHEAVASSLVLLGRERRNHDSNADTVAKVIAERRGLQSPTASADCSPRSAWCSLTAQSSNGCRPPTPGSTI